MMTGEKLSSQVHLADQESLHACMQHTTINTAAIHIAKPQLLTSRLHAERYARRERNFTSLPATPEGLF